MHRRTRIAPAGSKNRTGGARAETPAQAEPPPTRRLAAGGLCGLALLAGFALGLALEWLLRSLPRLAAPLHGPAPAAARPSAWTVHVNAHPWAWIRIDGKEAGATPLVHAGLAAGPHEFEARFPDGRQERRVVEIGPDSRFVAFR